MTSKEARELAEKHWEYTRKLLVIAGTIPDELHHFLYVEAMVHGIKHGEHYINVDDIKESIK